MLTHRFAMCETFQLIYSWSDLNRHATKHRDLNATRLPFRHKSLPSSTSYIIIVSKALLFVKSLEPKYNHISLHPSTVLKKHTFYSFHFAITLFAKWKKWCGLSHCRTMWKRGFLCIACNASSIPLMSYIFSKNVWSRGLNTMTELRYV